MRGRKGRNEKDWDKPHPVYDKAASWAGWCDWCAELIVAAV